MTPAVGRLRHIPDVTRPGKTLCGRRISSGLLVIDLVHDAIDDATCISCHRSDDRRNETRDPPSPPLARWVPCVDLAAWETLAKRVGGGLGGQETHMPTTRKKNLSNLITIPTMYYRALETAAAALSVLRDAGLKGWEQLRLGPEVDGAFAVFQEYQPDGDTYEENSPK
jgi:hypothetical protein